jgi:iron complex transport system ATP-binding protein
VLTQQHTPLALAFQVCELVLLRRYPHFGGQPTAHDHALVAAALELVGLGHLAGREYPTLSGSERSWPACWLRYEKLKMAFCCWMSPSPASTCHQHQTLAVARQLTRRGFGVVAVLHDLNLAAQYADQVLLLHQGRAVASGVPAEVFTPAYIHLSFDIEVELLMHPRLGHPLIVPTISLPC